MIDVTCKCGHTFPANDKHAGMRVRCPKCKFPASVPAPAPAPAPADGETWTAFERHQAKQLDRISAQLDYLGGIALSITYRLGWAVLFLLLLVGGCWHQATVVVNHR